MSVSVHQTRANIASNPTLANDPSGINSNVAPTTETTTNDLGKTTKPDEIDPNNATPTTEPRIRGKVTCTKVEQRNGLNAADFTNR